MAHISSIIISMAANHSKLCGNVTSFSVCAHVYIEHGRRMYLHIQRKRSVLT